MTHLSFGKFMFVGIVVATVVITALQVGRNITYRRGFDAGVSTALCAIDSARGRSLSPRCRSLNDHQRSYAVRVGREIVDAEMKR